MKAAEELLLVRLLLRIRYGFAHRLLCDFISASRTSSTQ